jgi:aquaporin Z
MSDGSAPRRPFAHVTEYLLDGLGLGLFLVSACAFALLLEHPGSPVRQALADGFTRRAFMGLAMGATLVALVHAPWGRRSGAHLSPAVTLAFWRLGHVRPDDLLGYALGQFAGAAAGVALVARLAGPALADPHVRFVVTQPGPAGAAVAFAAEFAITFALFSAVLRLMADERRAALTPWAAGALLALFITFESPFSGTSMNPARTFGSALLAGDWTGFALYLVAPPLATLAAAEWWAAAERRRRPSPRGCAKLLHLERDPCHFCGQPGTPASGTRAGAAAFTPVRRSA